MSYGNQFNQSCRTHTHTSIHTCINAGQELRVGGLQLLACVGANCRSCEEGCAGAKVFPHLTVNERAPNLLRGVLPSSAASSFRFCSKTCAFRTSLITYHSSCFRSSLFKILNYSLFLLLFAFFRRFAAALYRVIKIQIKHRF